MFSPMRARSCCSIPTLSTAVSTNKRARASRFEWEGSSIAGPWGAAGVLTAESLAVSYYENMLTSDFEDALYLRIP